MSKFILWYWFRDGYSGIFIGVMDIVVVVLFVNDGNRSVTGSMVVAAS